MPRDMSMSHTQDGGCHLGGFIPPPVKLHPRPTASAIDACKHDSAPQLDPVQPWSVVSPLLGSSGGARLRLARWPTTDRIVDGLSPPRGARRADRGSSGLRRGRWVEVAPGSI